ncbi:SDR family NAD(P)-dependent oxidoreductase [Corynebacterium endometrii]|uniref:Oxidoreductase SadH n=1 Tax=Corynebacterium endometrii TaxID=2488819 RepID=A0A4P7QEC7_9CORY|nr:SDR family NAD(P)-dependent oxidoreductase [Corynebacterium endometrii]QCB28012.1 Putative oxidoreductase SadH [Corynebacterium endometrii]
MIDSKFIKKVTGTVSAKLGKSAGSEGETMDLAGKAIVVTGGGNGIGKEVVSQLLIKGAKVYALDLKVDGLTQLQAAYGDMLKAIECDITDKDRIDELAAELQDTAAVINVAGIIQQFIPVAELDRATMERVMNVNFWGTVNVTTAFLPVLQAKPEAGIINISSMGGLVPVPGQSFYGASKAAVKLFTEGLFAELRETSVHVGVVFPGGVATDIMGNSGVERKSSAEEKNTEEAVASLTTPQDAAAQIIEALENKRVRTTIGKDCNAVDKMGRVAPVKAIELIARKMKDVG